MFIFGILRVIRNSGFYEQKCIVGAKTDKVSVRSRLTIHLKQAENSIVVNVLEHIFAELFKIDIHKK